MQSGNAQSSRLGAVVRLGSLEVGYYSRRKKIDGKLGTLSVSNPARLEPRFLTKMASQELTGASKPELQEMEADYYESPQFLNHNIPFELAYCLNPIAKQPEDYDGPQRFCKRRAAKKADEDFEGSDTDKAAFALCCHSHGGHVTKHGSDGGEQAKHLLDNPLTAAITHGAHAEDEHLIMDFNDHEQDLYDEIMEDWPEIYNWPDRSEDPARYRILRRVAVNEVRALREEEYIDGDEVVEVEDRDEQGVVMGTHDEENPLSREYRLLMSEVTDQMRELGLTPKERQKMDTLETEADANEAITEIASDAIEDSDQEYDPDQFNEGT